jgi:glycosyltransferase involved in cell wall biosynthesis
VKGFDAWLRLQHHQDPPRPAGSSISCGVNDATLWREHMIHMPDTQLREAEAAVVARALPSSVRFLGRIDRDALLREYRSALCLVCPAFDEDYGLTCIEAMACGKPVVACRDGGGYVELIDDGVDGFLVEPTGPAIARAIERLKQPGLARTMGERGRRKAQAYTVKRAVDHVERALQTAADRP